MLDRLPTDMLLEIFEYLRGFEELVHLSTLSRFLRVVVFPLIFAKITLSVEQEATASTATSFVRYISDSDMLRASVRCLVVSGLVKAPIQTLEHDIPDIPLALAQLTTLDSLNLAFTRISPTLFSIMNSFVQLSELSLLSCTVDDAISTPFSVPIHKLTYGFHPRTIDLEAEDVYDLIDNMRHKQFPIFSPPSVTSLTLMLQNLPYINTIIAGPAVRSKYTQLFESLRSFPALKHLHVHDRDVMYDLMVATIWSIILKHYPTITHLTLDHLEDLRYVDDIDGTDVPDLRFVSGIPFTLKWFVNGTTKVKHIGHQGYESTLAMLSRIDSTQVVSIDWTGGSCVGEYVDRDDTGEKSAEQLERGFEPLKNLCAVGFRFDFEFKLDDFFECWKPTPSIRMVWFSISERRRSREQEVAHAHWLAFKFKTTHLPELKEHQNITYLSFEVTSTHAPYGPILTWSVNPQTLEPTRHLSLKEWRERSIKEELAAESSTKEH